MLIIFSQGINLNIINHHRLQSLLTIYDSWNEPPFVENQDLFRAGEGDRSTAAACGFRPGHGVAVAR
jgi:hypothetical protein